MDRYAGMGNNTINRIDPTGHADITTGGGCDSSPETCKSNYVDARSRLILNKLGGRNDLEAMAQIVDTVAVVYKDYGKMMPVLSKIFNGKEESSIFTLYNAAEYNTGCAGLGRDPGDCGANAGLGNAFWDTGFHDDYRDGHNQIYHFWAYVTTAADTDGRIARGGVTTKFDRFLGLAVPLAGNIKHEIWQNDDGATWEDFALGLAGTRIGYLIGLGVIPPQKLGNYLRSSLGVNGGGSWGMVMPLSKIVPLAGNKRENR